MKKRLDLKKFPCARWKKAAIVPQPARWRQVRRIQMLCWYRALGGFSVPGASLIATGAAFQDAASHRAMSAVVAKEASHGARPLHQRAPQRSASNRPSDCSVL